MESPLKYLAELKDPRVERTREHVLEEILLIAIAAILSGASGWNEIENYGKAKIDWLRGFLTLPSGIPSHDTFNRVFAALDPHELEKGFVAGNIDCPSDGRRSHRHRRQGSQGHAQGRQGSCAHGFGVGQ